MNRAALIRQVAPSHVCRESTFQLDYLGSKAPLVTKTSAEFPLGYRSVESASRYASALATSHTRTPEVQTQLLDLLAGDHTTLSVREESVTIPAKLFLGGRVAVLRGWTYTTADSSEGGVMLFLRAAPRRPVQMLAASYGRNTRFTNIKLHSDEIVLRRPHPTGRPERVRIAYAPIMTSCESGVTIGWDDRLQLYQPQERYFAGLKRHALGSHRRSHSTCPMADDDDRSTAGPIRRIRWR